MTTVIDHHERHEDEVGAYLLGALTDAEARAFELHVASCESCREELARLQVATDALPGAVEPIEPPASLKRSLMRTVHSEARAKPSRLLDWLSFPSPALAGGLAAVVLAAGVGIGYAVSAGTRTDAPRFVSASVDGARAPGATARLVVPRGHAGAILEVAHLPPPGAGRIYEVWLKRGNEVVPASLFGVGADGRGAAAVARSLSGVDAVLVTRERARGASAPTSAPMIAART